MSGNPVVGKLDVVGSTLFSYVYAVAGDDNKTVLKTRELRCDGHVHALRLERSHMGAVRKYILDHPSPSEAPSVASRARMALDFAEGLGHCHARGVRCGDFSTRNVLLFDGLRVKLCDFGAATLKGSDFKPFQCYEVRYQLPPRGRDEDKVPRMAEELFALGSAIHEVMEWRVPFWGVLDYELDGRYADDDLPEVAADNITADVIRKCWQEEYESAGQVVVDLQRLLEGEVD